jgi:hypothetical protein
MACHDKNVIHDLFKKKEKKINYMICGMLFHVILTCDLIYPCHIFLSKNYLMQGATIQNK